MANHPSAEKRHRQSLKRRERNRQAKSAAKSSIKQVIEALGQGNQQAAQSQFNSATSLLDKAAIHGVVHKNNARRRISRLQKRINASTGQ